MRLCEVFPRELRYGQRTGSACAAASLCAPATDRPHRVLPYAAPPASRPTLYFTRAPHGRGRISTRNQEPLRAGLSEAPSLACRAEGGKKAPRLACHFKAESLRPTTPPRGPARPTQAAAPIGSQAARLRPRSPQARPHRTIPQAAGTGSALPPPPLSRLHAERAVAAPAFAADRSEFREFQSLFELTTANRLSWPYKPCLASSGGRSISLAVSLGAHGVQICGPASLEDRA